MILMAILGPKASAVVEAGRGPLRGTDADLERIEAALRARLGADVLPPDRATPAPSRGIPWRFVSPAIGVCVIGGALFFAMRPAGKAPPQVTHQQLATAAAVTSSAVSSEATIAPSATPEKAAEPPPAPPASAKTTGTPPNVANTRAEPDPLVREVALLSRATTALNNGRIAEALKALDEHQRLFPNGVLSEERRAAKAQALCSSGRISEGRAQLARLSPNSPAGKRAKQVCDSAPIGRSE